MADTKRNTYDSPYPGIVDVTSPEMHNICVLYATSDDDRFRVLGFQIARTVRRIERLPVTMTIPAGNEVPFGTIAADGHPRLGGSSASDDIFRIGENRDSTIEELGIGLSVDGADASELYVAYEGASGDPVIGVQGDDTDRARGFDEGSFNERGAVTADMTTIEGYEYPTTALSEHPKTQGLLRFDSREDGRNTFRFGFHNTSNSDMDVNLYGMGQAYRVRQVTDSSVIRNMVTTGGIPARNVTYGGFDNATPNLPSPWTNSIITVDRTELLPDL